jgi:DNA-binding NarL/FixJ family response regulator
MIRVGAGQGDRPAWDSVDAALAELRACRGATELADRSCELALAGCGADAVALGRVSDDVWTPWLRAGQVGLLETGGALPPGPVRVDDAPTVEREVIRSGRPGSRGLSTAQGGRTVVVAAVSSQTQVLGLLHVVSGGAVILDIVETYASALGSMSALLGVRQRADEQRYVLARLRNGLTELDERPIELLDSAFDRRTAAPSAHPEASSPSLRTRLTGRQREVLDLMLGGLSNAEIAERLVLAVPTVKSHVRAVLRAGGAVNRSEAVARFTRNRS